MSVKAQKVVKYAENQITKNTMVLINLSNNQNPQNRINVNEVTSVGSILGDDFVNSSGTKPAFPTDAIATVTASKLSESSKAAKIKSLLDDYEASSQQFASGGGLAIEDRIAAGVINWLVAHKGFTKDGKNNAPTVKPGELVVTTTITPAGELLYSITGQAVWGN